MLILVESVTQLPTHYFNASTVLKKRLLSVTTRSALLMMVRINVPINVTLKAKNVHKIPSLHARLMVLNLWSLGVPLIPYAC